ncbi:hypothetical protein GOP47_0028351 [Adiantum capillus-veneris]|nr:hypothetical protein GOP47_0028351 [Adiantum capillus-veneris]
MQFCSSDLSHGRAIVIMGVSGSGKSTIGKSLAESIGCSFLDADDFHSEESKEKMKQGIPLIDFDRLPWLETLRDTLIDYILREKTVVLACSALKPSYRELLRTADFERMLETQCEDEENREETSWISDSLKSFSRKSKELYGNQQIKGNRESHSPSHRVTFLLLNGPIELFASRVKERFQQGIHFMPPALLLSQVDSLAISEKEDDVILLDARLSPEEVVHYAKELVCKNA